MQVESLQRSAARNNLTARWWPLLLFFVLFFSFVLSACRWPSPGEPIASKADRPMNVEAQDTKSPTVDAKSDSTKLHEQPER
jgi:hypothetical protein